MNDIPSGLISSGVEGTEKTLSALSEDLGTEEVANGVDQITSEYTYQRRDASDNLGLQDHKVDQPIQAR